MEQVSLSAWTWLQVQLQRAREMTGREEGIVGMEYAVIAAVVIIAVAVAFNKAPIGEVITNGLNRVKAEIPA